MDTRTPEERDAQARAALNYANSIRSHRARLKVELKADPTVALAIALVAHPDALTASMRVGELIANVPGLGKAKAARLLTAAGVRSASRRLNALTDRERRAIIDDLNTHAARRQARRSASNGGPIS